MDSLLTCMACSKALACAVLARANGAKMRVADQLDICAMRTACTNASGNSPSNARRRLTQLASRAHCWAASRWLSPWRSINSRNISASSIGANARDIERASICASAWPTGQFQHCTSAVSRPSRASACTRR